MINSVVLTGRVTKDPELKKVGNDKVSVCSFTLAVNRAFSKEEAADFINVQLWNKSAEVFADHVKKGHLVGIEGRIQTRTYENDEGNTVYVTEVNGDSFTFLETKKSGNTVEEIKAVWKKEWDKSDKSDQTKEALKAKYQPVLDQLEDLPF